MDHSYLDLLNETFSDPSKLSLENLKNFVNETVKFFSEIKEKMASGDPVATEEALKTSYSVKAVLEDKMDDLCKLTGLDPSQLSMMSENPDNLNSDEYNLVKEAKNQLSVFVGQDKAPKNRLGKVV